jgi:ubiquinone/menaquinone biosynthesis C-methylase UbiE
MDERDRALVRAYYAASGEREWERLERPADGAVEFAVTTDTLGRYLPAGSRIIDVGGGPGRYAIWLAQRGNTVTLVDLSPELLTIARARVHEAGVEDRVTEIVEADACDLSRWENGSFDAALSLGPFYHLPAPADRISAARELARVLRPGGHLFVAVMPRLAFLRRTMAVPEERHHLLDAAWMRRLLDDGVFVNEVAGRFSLGYGVRPGEIERLLESQGFVTVDVRSVESLSAGVPGAVGDILEGNGALSDVVKRLMIDFAADKTVLGGAGHLLYVGQRQD